MDINGADFNRVIGMVKNRLKANAIAIQLPIGREDTFIGMINLVEMNAEYYLDDLGREMETREIPADLAQAAADARHILVETVAESDEELLVKYLDGAELSVKEIKAGYQKTYDCRQNVPCSVRSFL